MEVLSEKGEHVDSGCDPRHSTSPNSELFDESSHSINGDNVRNSIEVEETIHSMDEDGISNKNLLSQGPTLTRLQKIMNLSSTIQNLKKEHSILSDQVKGMAANSFPDPEATNMLLHFSHQHEILKKKYLEESYERKHLYNEVIELKGNIRVFCRCRPLNEVEIAKGLKNVVEFDSSQDNELQIISSDSSKKQFKFDHVFKPEDDQDAVFAQTKPIVTSVLDGYNVCIFAYGQTGTGKTFTMEGTPENRGVNYKTLEELFRISEERNNIMRYELYVSMLEVYNEKIKDLLVENFNQASKKLEIKQAADGTQEVPGLVEARVNSTEEVWELLKFGSQVRSVGSTNANELSSRSHCLLRVTIKGDNVINGQKTRSHLWLVDLAGSERVGKIDVEGERLKESLFINKSLSALGDVISALASKTGHIPYRNSKLTHMLQSSLGGDCKTLMFLQISPSSGDLGETLCSLNFASRVRGIESGPARKQADLTELFKLKQMAEKQRHYEKETKMLQDNVQSLQLRLATREQICRNLQEKVRDLENQLAEERKTRLKQETKVFAAAASTRPSRQAAPSSRQALVKNKPEKKPPLCPSKSRMPLRRITNIIPQASPLHSRKTGTTRSVIRSPTPDKENIPRMTALTANKKGSLMKPRRMSVVVRPSHPSKTSQVLQPKRRSSIATLQHDPGSYMTTPLKDPSSQCMNGSAIGRPSGSLMISQILQPKKRASIAMLQHDPSSYMTTPLKVPASKYMNGSAIGRPSGSSMISQILQPKRRASIAMLQHDPSSYMTTPLNDPASQYMYESATGRPSLLKASWKPRHSKLFSPLPEYRTASDIATPVAKSSSSKFMRSPLTQAGSWKPKHPTVVALQRKSLLWSPLKLKTLQSKGGSSLLPNRPSTDNQ